MDEIKNNWTLGELVTLPHEEKILKKGSVNCYLRYIGSNYVCIREAADGQRGILMKVMGKTDSERIIMVNGTPFSKDSREDLFASTRYLSYPFPTASEVIEALDIIRANPALYQKFKESSMRVNPDSTFWVSDTTRSMFFQKKLQYLDALDGQLHPDDDAQHYRVTFVYFYRNTLNW